MPFPYRKYNLIVNFLVGQFESFLYWTKIYEGLIVSSIRILCESLIFWRLSLANNNLYSNHWASFMFLKISFKEWQGILKEYLVIYAGMYIYISQLVTAILFQCLYPVLWVQLPPLFESINFELQSYQWWFLFGVVFITFLISYQAVSEISIGVMGKEDRR